MSSHDSNRYTDPVPPPAADSYIHTGTRPTLPKPRRWMPAQCQPYADPVASTFWHGCSLVKKYCFGPEPLNKNPSPNNDPLYGAELPPEIYDALSCAPQPMNAAEVLESVAEDVARTQEYRETVAKLWRLDEDYDDVGDSEQVEGFVGDDGFNKAGGVQQHFHLREARKMQLEAREQKKRETEMAFKPLQSRRYSSDQLPRPGLAPLRVSSPRKLPRRSTYGYGTDPSPLPSSTACPDSLDTSTWYGSPSRRASESEWEEVERPEELPLGERAKGAAVRKLVDSAVVTETQWKVVDSATRNMTSAAFGVVSKWWSAPLG